MPFHRVRNFAAVALVAGLPASAQVIPECAAGYSNFRLKPSTGGTQGLNGFFLTGRGILNDRWSLEGDMRSETGTDAAEVHLRQWTFMAGPRYTWTLSPKVEAYAHLMGGLANLRASQGPQIDQDHSAALAPGLGLDVRLSSRFLLRGQVDEVLTRYGSHGQQSLCLSLGVAFRGLRKGATPARPEAPPPAPVALAPAATLVPAPEPPRELPPPAPAAAPIPPPAVRIPAEDSELHFANGKAALTPETRLALARVAELLKKSRGEHALVVTGHASRVGPAGFNQKLSERRAETVAKVLAESGVPAPSIRTIGEGFRSPVASNKTRQGRARNRRVQLELKTREDVH